MRVNCPKSNNKLSLMYTQGYETREFKSYWTSHIELNEVVFQKYIGIQPLHLKV